MGHTRLGHLPRSRKWQEVVALIDAGAGTEQIANATIAAAEQSLKTAANDKGLVETIWLLTQLPLAAKSDNFVQRLRDIGLDVSNSPTLMEVTAAFSEAIDVRVGNNNGRTDLGEMAQMAATETIHQLVGSSVQSLFGTTTDDLKVAFGKYSTNKQFSALARDFFSGLTSKLLGYYLSRTLSNHTGPDQRFATLADQDAFSKALTVHSHQASLIVDNFSGGWFSKTNWEKGGITRKEASAFTHVAMKKLVSELKEGAAQNVE